MEQKPHSQKIDKKKRQSAMYQMKEQDKMPEKQLNEVEIGNLPEKEFRIMRVKMIQDLGKRMEAKTEKMKRQRAVYQMKEQEKTPEKQLNEVEIGNLPEKE